MDTGEACAERIIDLHKRPEKRAKMGAAARDKLRRVFLLPGLALDYLQAAKRHLGQESGVKGRGINKFGELATLS